MIRMKDVREDEILERNKNLNRGFRTLRVWREAIELYVFVKETLGGIKGLSFKIRDQILDSAKFGEVPLKETENRSGLEF